MKSKPDALTIGLKPEILNLLTAVFTSYEALDTVVLYGSRAKGTYHAGSDIDITLTGENLNDSLVGKIEEDIDNLLLPYSFDISLWSQIDNAELRMHIERVGIVIYQRL
jgi:predicted nucleotidyltransferase